MEINGSEPHGRPMQQFHAIEANNVKNPIGWLILQIWTNQKDQICNLLFYVSIEEGATH